MRDRTPLDHGPGGEQEQAGHDQNTDFTKRGNLLQRLFDHKTLVGGDVVYNGDLTVRPFDAQSVHARRVAESEMYFSRRSHQIADAADDIAPLCHSVESGIDSDADAIAILPPGDSSNAVRGYFSQISVLFEKEDRSNLGNRRFF